MAQVENVTLDIAYPLIGTGVAHVVVRSSLVFAHEEIGKDFKLKVELFGSDEGEGGLKPGLSAKPRYTFHFLPWRSFDTLRATQKVQKREDSADVQMDVLNEDPGYVFSDVETPLGSPPMHMRTPKGDEIYAVVSLLAEGRSAAFEMKYVGTLVT